MSQSHLGGRKARELHPHDEAVAVLLGGSAPRSPPEFGEPGTSEGKRPQGRQIPGRWRAPFLLGCIIKSNEWEVMAGRSEPVFIVIIQRQQSKCR